MDKLEKYRPIIRRILGQYLEETPREEQIESFGIIDELGEHYIFMEVGWQPPRRVYNIVFHVRLKDDKIYIEQDWTEYGVARHLIEAGIPVSAIEMAMKAPELRPWIEWTAVMP